MKDNTPWIKVSELKPHPNNPNEHPPEQLVKIAENIKKLGWGRPILISKDYYILAGHGAYYSAKDNLGMLEVPYRMVEYNHDSPEARSLMLSDNKLAEESYLNNDKLQFNIEQVQLKGFNTELTGFDNIELQKLDDDIKGKQEIIEDNIPEEVEPICKLGDLYQLGNHRLLCGDATNLDDVQKLVDNNKIDLVFTDPPYDFEDFSYFNHLKNISNEIFVMCSDK